MLESREEVIKSNLGILKKFIEDKGARVKCYYAFINTINSLNRDNISEDCRLIGNKYVLFVLKETYSDWFSQLDTSNEMRKYVLEDTLYEKLGYSIKKFVGEQQYEDNRFFLRFKELLGKEYKIEKIREDIEGLEDIDGLEESDDLEENNIGDGTNWYIKEINQRLRAVLSSCYQLDKAIGLLIPNGILVPMRSKATGTVISVAKETPILRELYKMIGECITNDALNLFISRKANKEDLLNYISDGYLYFPQELIGYASGYLNNKKHTKWVTVEDVIKEDLSKLLEYIPKDLNRHTIGKKLVSAYSTLIVVLRYSEDIGVHIRVSIPGGGFNPEKFKTLLKADPSFSNNTVIVNTLGDTKDAFDVQIIMDLDKYLSTPTWGYQAFEASLRNNIKPDIYKGLPIGRKLSGEIVTFKLDPSKMFLNFLAAGSGAGKGVLTLTITSACLGAGIPLFYTDCKPDMASVFLNLSKKYNKRTYSFDGAILKHEYGYNAEESLPEEVRNEFLSIAPTLVYLKSLEWMFILAKYRASVKATKESGGDVKTNTSIDLEKRLFFVFDESEVAQARLGLVVSTIKRVLDSPDHKPSKTQEASMSYKYAKKLASWLQELVSGMNEYIKATGRKSDIVSLFIGQSTVLSGWSVERVNGTDIDIFTQPFKAGTVNKFLGKGTGGPYGSQGIKMTNEERECVDKYRFFIHTANAQPTTGTVFKTFLTLNYDDPNAGCWKSLESETYTNYKDDIEKYYDVLAKKYPGKGRDANKYNMHIGTGLEGLALMYCDYDTNKLGNCLGESWEYSNAMLSVLGMDKTYKDIGEFLFDFSDRGFLKIEEALAYDTYIKGYEENNSKIDIALDDWSEVLMEEPVSAEMDLDDIFGGLYDSLIDDKEDCLMENYNCDLYEDEIESIGLYTEEEDNILYTEEETLDLYEEDGGVKEIGDVYRGSYIDDEAVQDRNMTNNLNDSNFYKVQQEMLAQQQLMLEQYKDVIEQQRKSMEEQEKRYNETINTLMEQLKKVIG